MPYAQGRSGVDMNSGSWYWDAVGLWHGRGGECEVLALISLQPYEQKSEMINSEGAVV